MDSQHLTDELRKDILLGFHTQFAENQRNREAAFLKFLALLGAALAGYAFLFRNPPETPTAISAVLFFQIAIATVLYSGARLVAVISNNFRRDQYVNVRIRTAAGLMGSNAIFPRSYDPREGLKRWGIFSWMPDFLQAFFWLFGLFQVGALVAFAHLAQIRFAPPMNFGITLVVVVSLVLAFWSIFVVPWTYRSKLLGVMKLDPVEYGIPAAVGRRLGKLSWPPFKRIWRDAIAGFRNGWNSSADEASPELPDETGVGT